MKDRTDRVVSFAKWVMMAHGPNPISSSTEIVYRFIDEVAQDFSLASVLYQLIPQDVVDELRAVVFGPPEKWNQSGEHLTREDFQQRLQQFMNTEAKELKNSPVLHYPRPKPPEPLCPFCGKPLRTPRSKQCRWCNWDWHNPENVYRRE